MNPAVERLISTLQLEPHPEGGYYRETYRSGTTIRCPWEGSETRHVATSIYFLLVKGNFSAFHRIKSDEVWHFYEGNPIDVWVISQDGNAVCHTISEDLRQLVVPAGCWFASCSTGEYSLAGCTVSPGFDFRDFELANREELIRQFPEQSRLITDYTRV